VSQAVRASAPSKHEALSSNPSTTQLQPKTNVREKDNSCRVFQVLGEPFRMCGTVEPWYPWVFGSKETAIEENPCIQFEQFWWCGTDTASPHQQSCAGICFWVKPVYNLQIRQASCTELWALLGDYATCFVFYI
jgi:hypothetical protein